MVQKIRNEISKLCKQKLFAWYISKMCRMGVYQILADSVAQNMPDILLTVPVIQDI